MPKVKRLYLDVETTGVDPLKCGLTQVAFIIEVEGREQVSGNFNVRPFEGALITEKALEITGKTYDEIMAYPDEASVFNTFITILKEFINPGEYGDDFTLIAYNAEFDQNFLIEWFNRMGKKYPNYINYRKVDPLALLRILHVEEITNLPSYKLSVVYKAIFDEGFDAHDAVADIKATIRVYEYLIANYIRDPRAEAEVQKNPYYGRPHTEDMGS